MEEDPEASEPSSVRRQIEAAVLGVLHRVRVCTIEELIERLPAYTWCQVFTAVDCLRKSGKVDLQHPAPLEYRVSLPRDNKSSKT